MSDREYPLYTIKNNCVDCYKCVRRCPVKAIKIEDGSAQIVPDLCIACGTCYRVCPAKAKQPRNDLTRAKHLIESGKDVYVSLAPSWIAEFDGLPAEKMIASRCRRGGSFRPHRPPARRKRIGTADLHRLPGSGRVRTQIPAGDDAAPDAAFVAAAGSLPDAER